MAEAMPQEIHGFEPPFVTENDRVVVVLGAGASISEMLKIKQKLLPPTDANFLEIARQCANAKYEQMESAFDELWKGDEPWPLKYQRMEALFSSAYLRVQQTSGNSQGGRAARLLYDSLVEMLRDTLSDTTGKAKPTQHLQFLKSIADRNPKKLSVLSFNYDVLADRALLEGPRAGLWRWSHTDGYGFTPKSQSVPKERSTLTLLKLHGSMNWYIPTPGRTRANVYAKHTPVYVPQPARNSKAPAWQRRRSYLGHSANRVFPLLVPPVFEKGTQIIGVLQSVWNQASVALREATVVFVWAILLRRLSIMLKCCSHSAPGRREHRLIAINPSREALARATEVCGHTWNRWYFKMDHLERQSPGAA